MSADVALWLSNGFSSGNWEDGISAKITSFLQKYTDGHGGL